MRVCRETLLKYLHADVRGVYVKRSRGFGSKTFDLAYKIMRVEVTFYHVHYLSPGLFYCSCLIGHAHGAHPNVVSVINLNSH